jgi:hypothetical protein
MFINRIGLLLATSAYRRGGRDQRTLQLMGMPPDKRGDLSGFVRTKLSFRTHCFD